MTTGPHRWRRLRSSVAEDHSIFQVRKDVSVSPRTGEMHEFIVLDSRDWVLVVPFLTDGRLVMIRQYRHGLADLTLEVPGGLVEDGLSTEEAGREELRQETGYGGGTWMQIGELSAVPAVFSNTVHVFVAEGVQVVGDPEPDAAEDIRVELHHLEEVRQAARKGSLVHAQVLAAFYLLEAKTERGTDPR